MIALVAILAGAVGAVLRYLLTRILGSQRGVLLVNAVGSLVGGVVLAMADPDLRLILLSGFCGGLTTFSTLSVDTVELALAGRTGRAALNIALNLVVGVAAAALGYLLFS